MLANLVDELKKVRLEALSVCEYYGLNGIFSMRLFQIIQKAEIDQREWNFQKTEQFWVIGKASKFESSNYINRSHRDE